MSCSRHLGVALVALFIATPLVAQDTSRADTNRDTAVVASPTSGAEVSRVVVAETALPLVSLAPTRASVTAGIQLRTEGFAPTPTPSPGRNNGNTALMIVGGAALIVGSIIDGDAGTLIMVSGGVIGLYGLWQYLK